MFATHSRTYEYIGQNAQTILSREFSLKLPYSIQ